MTRPTFGGVPDRVRPGDWRLVEWVATAKPGDPYPEPWCHAQSPLKTMVGLLAELGVIDPPAPGTDVATIAHASTEAARRWLERNPQPAAAPQQVARRMTWGPLELARHRARLARDVTADAASAAAVAAAQVASGAREFVLRAEQQQLAMLVEHRYELQTREREPDAVAEYRREPVRSLPLWRLNTQPPSGPGAPGPAPEFDEHYVTRDHEPRVSAARWEGDRLRHAPTCAVEEVTPELAQLLVDKMIDTLAGPQRHERTGERDGRDADGLAVWLGPQGEQLPSQAWTESAGS